ncbi:hypothetical protein Pla108_21440 [Botrimarina colliarenosi]|uniref:Uncharacterized protein n=1 Tax=Botrimarina colliarenosi TaxID=2528001 RepID=A0A5C6AEF6_9BACT|nr:hypothetical protein [Botrimarina colliarenosi]TWT97989.1 hypothetical protein Pla108_21440 [Botrimarina colliarenosi]
MKSPREGFDAASVEAMLQGAGGYIGPSEDLRPRVLEEARRLRGQGRRRQRMTMAAGSALALVALVAIPAASLNEVLTQASPSQRVARIVAADHATAKRAGVEGLCWTLVDAFLRVRSEQAEALRPTKTATDSADPSSDAFAAQTADAGGSF